MTVNILDICCYIIDNPKKLLEEEQMKCDYLNWDPTKKDEKGNFLTYRIYF